MINNSIAMHNINATDRGAVLLFLKGALRVIKQKRDNRRDLLPRFLYR